MTTAPPTLRELPEPVRGRVTALVAGVLPSVVRLPPALRRVADFAPARRARLGATAIAAALEDEEFRERAAVQVAAATADQRGADVDPVDRAALAWLLRGEGWEAAYDEACAHLAEAPVPAADPQELERLRAKVARQEQELRDLRAAHRAELEQAKAENTTLRRRLGESRAAATDAQRLAEEAAARATRATEQAAADDAARAKEVRQLRARVAELEAGRGAGRRAERDERDAATQRARLLLDTVIDAAAGLRRELGLPAVGGTPGQRIEDALAGEAGAGEGVRSAGALDAVLAMPRSRLIVDGYNVSKRLWPTIPLDAQRARLAGALAPVVARTGAETTIVFDASAATTRTPVPTPRGLRVVFSPPGVIADDVIRDLVAAEPAGRVVVVVSDDQQVARDVTRAGARAVAVDVLAGLLEQGR